MIKTMRSDIGSNSWFQYIINRWHSDRLQLYKTSSDKALCPIVVNVIKLAVLYKYEPK